MILLQPELIPNAYKKVRGITKREFTGGTKNLWLQVYSYLQPSYFTRIRLKCLCRLFNDVEKMITFHPNCSPLKPIPLYTSFPHPNYASLRVLVNHLNALSKKETDDARVPFFVVSFDDETCDEKALLLDEAFFLLLIICVAAAALSVIVASSSPALVPLFTLFVLCSVLCSVLCVALCSALCSICKYYSSASFPVVLPSLLLIADGIHDQQGRYIEIDFPLTIVGESKAGCTIIGGLKMAGKIKDDVNVKHLTVSQSKGSGVNGWFGMAFHLFHVNIEKSGGNGICVGDTKRNTMSNCQVSHSKCSGVFVWGGLMTMDGSGTSIHNNVTGGHSLRYGLHTRNSTSSIHLVSPLTKESISINNGGAGNYNSIGTIKTIPK